MVQTYWDHPVLFSKRIPFISFSVMNNLLTSSKQQFQHSLFWRSFDNIRWCIMTLDTIQPAILRPGKMPHELNLPTSLSSFYAHPSCVIPYILLMSSSYSVHRNSGTDDQVISSLAKSIFGCLMWDKGGWTGIQGLQRCHPRGLFL